MHRREQRAGYWDKTSVDWKVGRWRDCLSFQYKLNQIESFLFSKLFLQLREKEPDMVLQAFNADTRESGSPGGSLWI